MFNFVNLSNPEQQYEFHRVRKNQVLPRRENLELRLRYDLLIS